MSLQVRCSLWPILQDWCGGRRLRRCEIARCTSRDSRSRRQRHCRLPCRQSRWSCLALLCFLRLGFGLSLSLSCCCGCDVYLPRPSTTPTRHLGPFLFHRSVGIRFRLARTATATFDWRPVRVERDRRFGFCFRLASGLRLSRSTSLASDRCSGGRRTGGCSGRCIGRRGGRRNGKCRSRDRRSGSGSGNHR